MLTLISTYTCKTPIYTLQQKQEKEHGNVSILVKKLLHLQSMMIIAIAKMEVMNLELRLVQIQAFIVQTLDIFLEKFFLVELMMEFAIQNVVMDQMNMMEKFIVQTYVKRLESNIEKQNKNPRTSEEPDQRFVKNTYMIDQRL